MIRKIHFFAGGSCTQREALAIAGGPWKKIRFPAMFAVIEHARAGVILFDTGYARRSYDAMRAFPEKLYSLATPVSVTAEETAVSRLKMLGIRQEDVRFVICSHFHADHLGGAADFPRATYVFAGAGYERVRGLSRFRAVCAGFLKALLPGDFERRARMLAPEEFATRASSFSDFHTGYDLFGDQSVMLLEMAGHAAGHIGAVVREESGKTYLLIGDACWLEASYRRNVPPPSTVARLFFDDRHQYLQTLGRIHEFSQAHPEVIVVPSHCPHTLARISG
jgi:glyoxylase-like metal-dependent hydrolase (beta-lactamase superfamily II)